MTSSESTRTNPIDPWTRETQRVIRTVFKLRFGFAFLMALVLLAFALWDRTPWKLIWLGVTGLAMLILSSFEYWRIRQSPAGPRTVQVNLAAVLLLQSSIVYVTGGIESPFMMIYVPLGLITGLSLGSVRLAAPVIAVPLLVSLLFAVGALGGWLLRPTPAFFGLGAGFWSVPVYVWTKATLVIVLLTGTSMVGVAIRRLYEGIVHQVADARRETLRTLASRNREILSVSSTVAHELKNPLTSIQGLAQLMLRSVSAGSKDHERLEVMLREIGRMRTVLDEFRGFSRPLSGLQLERVGLTDLIGDLILLSEGSAGSKRLAFEAPSEDISMLCDPHKLKQALLNLVQNGLDATPPEGRIELRIDTQRAGWVAITVGDSGPGLAPEIAARPFTPGLTTKPHGSGIGLVVARSIAEQHGGRLTLENSPKIGCIATLTLPLVARNSPEDCL